MTKKKPVVERKLRARHANHSSRRIYRMRLQEDLDTVLDRIFGEGTYPTKELQRGVPSLGKILTPMGEELNVYKETTRDA